MREAGGTKLVPPARLTACRPLSRVFTAHRTQARAQGTATHGPQAHHDRDLTAKFAAAEQLRAIPPAPDQLGGVLDNLGYQEATPASLRTLIGRVHQGCRLLLEAGQPEQCLQLLQASSDLILDAPLPNEHVAMQLVLGLIARTNTATALSALGLVAPNARVYRAALRAFAAKGSLRGVSQVVRVARGERVLKGPNSRDLWLEAVAAFGRLGRIEEARRMFKAMRQQGAWSPADTQGANILLHAIHTDLLQTFVRYRQFVEEGVRPDASTFNVLLKACMRGRDARRAQLAHGWMQDAGVPGDETTFNTLIKAFSYAGEFEKVLGVRELMRREEFEATPRIWGSLLVACGAAGEVEQACVLWAELKQRHKELQQLATAAAAAGGVPAGEATEGAASSNAEAPGGSSSSAESSRGSGRGTAGAQQAAGAGGGVLTTEVFNAMMTACIEGYQGERALCIFAELRAEPGVAPDLRAYNLAIKGCESPPNRALRPQQLATALELREEMRLWGLQPDVFTYGTLIDLCARAKEGSRALALHDEMLAAGVRPNKTVISSLFKALGAAGMVDDCMRIFRRIVWGPSRVRPNLATYRHLLHALKENGALGHALRVYEGMREVGYPARNQEFNELISAAAEHALRQQDTALQQQVLALSNITLSREVDLHGMSSTEARAAVLCVLSSAQQRYAQEQQRRRDGEGSGGEGLHEIALITGCGRNSADGEAVLPKVVLKLLREELGVQVDCLAGTSASTTSSSSGGTGGGSSAEQQPDAAAASGQQAAGVAADAGEGQGEGGDGVRVNAGRIIITKQALLQWLEGKRARVRGAAEGSVDFSGAQSQPA